MTHELEKSSSAQPPWRQRRGFFPIKSPEGKLNCKPHFRIERDGTAVQSVFLNVPDLRIREYIICIHFLRSYVRWVLQETIGFNILSRDLPWDFAIGMSNGTKVNIEIVSIADNEQLFKNNKREEELDVVANMKKISRRRLDKINRLFSTEKIVGNNYEEGIDNPWYTHGKRVVVSHVPPPDGDLFQLLERTIASKASKPHMDKRKTILIVDNRTSAFDINDFHEAASRFSKLKSKCPFREVWFYTGYYSDNDGCSAEWSLAPVLVSNRTAKRMRSNMALLGSEPDQDGIVYGDM